MLKTEQKWNAVNKRKRDGKQSGKNRPAVKKQKKLIIKPNLAFY